MTAARSSTRRADKSVDRASFLDLLAATAQQQPAAKPQTDTTSSTKDDADPPRKKTDRQSDPAQTAPQPAIHGSAVRDGGKLDKKADLGKGKNEDGPSDSRQTEAAQPPPVPAITQQVSHSIAATPATGDDDDDDSIETSSVLASGQGGADPLAQTAMSISADGNPAGQPNVPGPIAPSQPPAADDDADPADGVTEATKAGIARDLGDSLAGNARQPVGPTPSGDGKITAGRGAGNQAAETQVPPAPEDRSPDPVTQIAIAAPPASNEPQSNAALQIPLTAGTGDGRSVDAPDAKSDIKDKIQTGASDQITPRTGDSTPIIAASSRHISTTAPSGSENDKPADGNPARVASSSDSKSGRPSVSDAAPQPQVALAAPVTHAPAPSNTAPQGLMTIDPVGANPAAGSANAMVDTAVQIAPANADPAPNLDALAVSIAARSLSGAKQFEIRLDPPELGRVDVRLSIDASGKTQAHMTADQPQTLDMLKKDAPTLTQALRDAGLDVSQEGLNFSLRGQDHQNSDSGTGQGRRSNLTATRTLNAAQAPAAISFNGAAADARVDIHV